MSAATHLIVHTETARAALIAKGRDPRRVTVAPHGPLVLSTGPAPSPAPSRPPGAPWRLVLFGKLQLYKGVDVLVEALGHLSPRDRAGLEVIVAGEPLMPMAPLLARVAELDLGAVVQFRLKRLDETEMAALFEAADAFVFPYRQIEASGVLHLVLPYGRWIVSSDLGAFRQLVIDGESGERTPPGDPHALAEALLRSRGRRPPPGHASHVTGWDEIGRRTRAVYEDALGSAAAAGQAS